MVRHGDPVIDEQRREVTGNGRVVPLASAEFRIREFLASCPGRVMFRRTSPPGEFLLGRSAVRMNLLTREKRRKALAAQERNPSWSLGEMLVERAFLGEADFERILDVQRRGLGELDGSGSSFLGCPLVSQNPATSFQISTDGVKDTSGSILSMFDGPERMKRCLPSSAAPSGPARTIATRIDVHSLLIARDPDGR